MFSFTQTKENQQWHTLEDGFDNLTRGTAPMPVPGQDEVLVEIKAVSLNYRDTEVCNGEYNHHKTLSKRTDPLVPCSDALGVIVAVGPSSSSSSESTWKVGDRVLSTFNQSHFSGQIKGADMASGLGKPLDGVLQTYRVFPRTGLVKAPEYLTDEEASCLPIAALTAWMAIFGMEPFGTWSKDEGKPLKGKTVVLEGTGGVAVAGLQIAKAAGATTIITSSSDEKLRRAKEELGADHVINYKTTENWEEKVMEITQANDGADIILETGGAGTLYKALDCIAFGGLISCIGYTSGKEDKTDGGEGSRMNLNLLALRRNVTLKGIINGPRDRFEEMCEFYERHQIRPVVDKVFGFEQGGEAIKYLRSGSHFGKVVVKVQ